MASAVFRTALLGAVTGAALGLGVSAGPAKALSTLVDNTSQATAPGTGSVATSLSQNRALSFSVFTNNKSIQNFILTTNITADPGSQSLLVRIFEINNLSEQPNLASSPIDEITFGYTGNGVAANYTFVSYDTSLESSKYYAFVFSDPANTSFASINGSSQSFALGTPFTPGSSFFTLNNGTSWAGTSAPYFYLTDVPGPLPLLGAGTAFAYSRRLRRRVKHARQNPACQLSNSEA